ncbi:unnamed protein product, partial [Meganyctiphanes norvegica]
MKIAKIISKLHSVEALLISGLTLQRIAVPQRSQGDGEEQEAPPPTMGPDATGISTPTQTKDLSTQQKVTPKSIKKVYSEKYYERTKSESEDVSSEKTPKAADKKSSHSEKSKSHKVPEVHEIASKLSRASIMSTPDDVFLNTPSNIGSKKMFQITPKALLNTPQAHKTPSHSSWTSKSDTISTHKEKEPKFVPYEPYKGCVKPIYKNKKTKKRIGKNDSFTSLKEKVISETKEEKDASNENNSLSVEKVEKKSADRLAAVLKDFEAERAKWEEEKRSLTASVAEQEEQLKQLRKEKGHLEDQITVSVQVNSELKKLLVASVGEDVQGRVQVLTEDKARMATMIRRYSERVEKDFEEKQSMGIQCDVWRSKFLASSIIVDIRSRLDVLVAREEEEPSDAMRLQSYRTQVSSQHHVGRYDFYDSLWRNAFYDLVIKVKNTGSVSLTPNPNSQTVCLRHHVLRD